MCNVAGVVFAAKSLLPDEIRGRRVLEVGSRDVNGGLRPILESWHPAEYLGVDVAPGPGVDQVCPAEALAATFGEARFDVVVSTEVIEHVEDWRSVLSNMKRVLAPGGLILLTTRSPGYPYHAFPHDFWRYDQADMRRIFADFELLALEDDPSRPGVFLKARKPATWAEADLTGHALHSIVTGTRVLSLKPSDFRTLRHARSVALDRLKGWVTGAGQRVLHGK
ncbi:MAG: class I SAM-dependent methyltransferase [Candidatus Sericytochromatia bacterium]